MAITLVSCQFSETMVLSEDGSGTIKIAVDLSEMMAFGGEALGDTVPMKMDTIIYIKQFLEEKKDSIATLSASEQKKLKELENFNFGMKVDSETSEMVYDISTHFKNINEANNLMNGLEQIGNLSPKLNSGDGVKKDEDSKDVIGVNYSFKNGVFKRDAYIKDKKLHKNEVDSLKNTEAFLSSSMYKLNYTFPKKIKKASNSEATYSADKKTIILEKPFIEYFKNPDLLDLEIELEK
jgi:hypothetical protein